MLNCGESDVLGLPTAYTKCKRSRPKRVKDAQAAGWRADVLRAMQVGSVPGSATLRQVKEMSRVNLRSRQRSRRSGIPMLRDWLVSRPKAPPEEAPPASVPHGVRIYAVGDLHGRPDLLDQVLARIDADVAANPVPQPIEVFIGDYVDRGPGSREVVDRLLTRSEPTGPSA